MFGIVIIRASHCSEVSEHRGRFPKFCTVGTSRPPTIPELDKLLLGPSLLCTFIGRMLL